ncbi:MAG TPA: leucyl/phenylalanyl-tRNA--protein transferase [Candidatus Paenalcaligenes intestinipullorum]|uniref:Leucyl/phenylalanyl-tRNA--protein transferase n=1 Tax=Candidatus Paenalcaligenes intestinipullorum TaxID=2838718 RepID=A0A9D2RET6_9BURK|nr:leucyl/phenylalanyl-tRNA--protein transferase [Candidatus Paenalcaligenes intestinipullorum]
MQHRLAFLQHDTPFPPVECALPDGLLAVGGDLSVGRLSSAYYQGIFPWYNESDPILWWSPDPRMVLDCEAFKVSRSLGKKCRQIARQEALSDAPIQVLINANFLTIMANCANARAEGTWISTEVMRGYYGLHRVGQAHSIEVWRGSQLMGGLYGVSVGRFFVGESMFYRETDGSKIAVYYLVQLLKRHGIQHIDCQQSTTHLRSLGAANIRREEFLQRLYAARDLPSVFWPAGQLFADGRIRPFNPCLENID